MEKIRNNSDDGVHLPQKDVDEYNVQVEATKKIVEPTSKRIKVLTKNNKKYYIFTTEDNG
jgi:hypothetical protein